MRLIAILLALWAKQFPNQLDRLRVTETFDRYAFWLRNRLLPVGLWDNPVGVALLLLPPVVAVWLLQSWITGWFGGLGGMVLSLVMMVFAFSDEHSDQLVEVFVTAWRSGDREGARRATATLNGVVVLQVPDERLPETAVRGLFCHSHERVFGVIFWLVLLGPVGAFAYHLIVLARRFAGRQTGSERGFGDAIEGLAWLVGWLPSHATAGAFALAGSFIHCLEGWREARRLPEKDSNAQLLAATGLGALGLGSNNSVRDLLDQTLHDARSLIRRAIMVWLVAIALLTLFGWIA